MEIKFGIAGFAKSQTRKIHWATSLHTLLTVTDAAVTPCHWRLTWWAGMWESCGPMYFRLGDLLMKQIETEGKLFEV